MRPACALVAALLLVACPKRDPSLYTFAGDGRLPAERQHEVWAMQRPDLGTVEAPGDWATAVERHTAILNRAKDRPGAIISVAERQRVLRALGTTPKAANITGLTFLRLRGDGTGNVQFTGYYTPVIDARRQPDERFKHALYGYPTTWSGKGPHLSRSQIDDEEALRGQGLELAYTADASDNFFMQVQGSGMLRYPDGSLEMLAYAGKNGHRYVSVGRLLVERGAIDKARISMNTIRAWCAQNPEACHALYNENPSYVFFRRGPKGPVGAAGEIVSAAISVAVDPSIIPLGSTLLARLPVLGPDGMVTRHAWRLLLAQDTGGAIKGTAHIDLYTGIGDAAAGQAQALHHYGQVWLLKPHPAAHPTK